MWRDLRGAVVAIVLCTLALGFAYPAVMTGFAQVAFKDKANGSLVTLEGKEVQEFLLEAEYERPDASAIATVPVTLSSK